MNALFYITVFRKHNTKWLAFVVTTPDGPHDRHATVVDSFTEEFRREYGPMNDPARVHAEFVCLTPESVWREV